MYNQNQLESLLKNEHIHDEQTIEKIRVYIESLKMGIPTTFIKKVYPFELCLQK